MTSNNFIEFYDFDDQQKKLTEGLFESISVGDPTAKRRIIELEFVAEQEISDAMAVRDWEKLARWQKMRSCLYWARVARDQVNLGIPFEVKHDDDDETEAKPSPFYQINNQLFDAIKKSDPTADQMLLEINNWINKVITLALDRGNLELLAFAQEYRAWLAYIRRAKENFYDTYVNHRVFPREEQEALNRIPKDKRERWKRIKDMRDKGKTQIEIAEAVNASESTVKRDLAEMDEFELWPDWVNYL